MANNKTKSSDENVVRIKAKDDPKTDKKSAPKEQTNVAAPKAKKEEVNSSERKDPARAIVRYFRGAWYELKQVRWPTRRATIGMTIAVIVFSLVLTGLVLLVDLGFGELFKLII